MGIEFFLIAVATAGLIAGILALPRPELRRAEVRVDRTPRKR